MITGYDDSFQKPVTELGDDEARLITQALGRVVISQQNDRGTHFECDLVQRQTMDSERAQKLQRNVRSVVTLLMLSGYAVCTCVSARLSRKLGKNGGIELIHRHTGTGQDRAFGKVVHICGVFGPNPNVGKSGIAMCDQWNLRRVPNRMSVACGS
jgi:hypothetical protein